MDNTENIKEVINPKRYLGNLIDSIYINFDSLAYPEWATSLVSSYFEFIDLPACISMGFINLSAPKLNLKIIEFDSGIYKSDLYYVLKILSNDLIRKLSQWSEIVENSFVLIQDKNILYLQLNSKDLESILKSLTDNINEYFNLPNKEFILRIPITFLIMELSSSKLKELELSLKLINPIKILSFDFKLTNSTKLITINL